MVVRIKSSRDIVDRLEEIAKLKNGDDFPQHMIDENRCWGTAMSALLNDAIEEILRLRKAMSDA